MDWMTSRIVMMAAVFIAAVGGEARATVMDPSAAAVLPVLREHCLKCHNAKYRDAKFDLLDNHRLHADPRGLVLPADNAKSDALDAKIWQVIVDGEMPPYDEKPLTRAEIDLIRAWLLAGAPPLILPAGENLSAEPLPSRKEGSRDSSPESSRTDGIVRPRAAGRAAGRPRQPRWLCRRRE